MKNFRSSLFTVQAEVIIIGASITYCHTATSTATILRKIMKSRNLPIIKLTSPSSLSVLIISWYKALYVDQPNISPYSGIFPVQVLSLKKKENAFYNANEVHY